MSKPFDTIEHVLYKDIKGNWYLVRKKDNDMEEAPILHALTRFELDGILFRVIRGLDK